MLILDPQAAGARLLGELVREAARPATPDVWAAESAAKTLRLAAKVDPQLIFCALSDGAVDGAAFTRALRRSDLSCRQAPVILLTRDASPAAVLAGRDAGAHELLRQPFARKDVLRRIEAVMLHPRGWVEAMDYVGPDRRRFNSAAFDGPLKRLTDTDARPQSVRIGEALKIAGAALAALDRDPRQAWRALLAQTAALETVAAEAGDARLALATAELRRCLVETPNAAPDAAQIRGRAQALLAYAGREPRAAA